MAGRLLAGAARAAINPLLGVRTMGFSSRVGYVESIASDLTATTLVLANQQTAVAIVALDICLLPISRADTLRRAVGEAIGAPAANVLVNFSHTHSAPAFPGWQPESAEQTRLQELPFGNGHAALQAAREIGHEFVASSGEADGFER